MLEQTPEGWWVIQGETHLNKWVREHKRLDHDQGLIGQVLPHIEPKSVVIDCGASIGDHTIAYLRANPTGIVCAYEPHPEAFEALVLNCPNAVHCRCAVGATVGTTKMIRETGNIGMSRLDDSGDIEVNITTLDSDFSQLLSPMGWNKVSYIKIDVEGCEPEVLQGAEGLVDLYHPVFLIELNILTLHQRNHEANELKDFFVKHRYRIRFIPDGSSWESERAELLCVPL